MTDEECRKFWEDNINFQGKKSIQIAGVYFIQMDNLVKIGVSNHLAKRTAAIITHLPYPATILRIITTKTVESVKQNGLHSPRK